MGDKPNKPHSDPSGANYTGKDRMVQKEMDAQVKQIRDDDERQLGGKIPENSGDDFTFPDEGKDLGSKRGDDLPNEPSRDRD